MEVGWNSRFLITFFNIINVDSRHLQVRQLGGRALKLRPELILDPFLDSLFECLLSARIGMNN